MSVENILTSLQIPDVTDPQSLLKAAASFHPEDRSVRLEGVLVGKNASAVYIRTANALYQIGVSSLTSLEIDKSQPSQDQLDGGVAVVVSISPDEDILTLTTVRAASLRGNVGIRPMTFAIPSETARYATMTDLSMLEPSQGPRPTPGVTPHETPYQTPKDTLKTTWDPRTGRDNIDSSPDSERDTTTDNPTDWSDD